MKLIVLTSLSTVETIVVVLLLILIAILNIAVQNQKQEIKKFKHLYDSAKETIEKKQSLCEKYALGEEKALDDVLTLSTNLKDKSEKYEEQIKILSSSLESKQRSINQHIKDLSTNRKILSKANSKLNEQGLHILDLLAVINTYRKNPLRFLNIRTSRIETGASVKLKWDERTQTYVASPYSYVDTIQVLDLREVLDKDSDILNQERHLLIDNIKEVAFEEVESKEEKVEESNEEN
jgi:ribosomal protein S15P/S13E